MEMFERTTELVGAEAFARIQKAKVLLVGVGGVGGWCAEALVRSGIQHLTIIDMDTVSESNLNRQVVATSSNIGKSKVEEMRRRLLDIQPDADICAIHARYTPEGRLDDGVEQRTISLGEYDYIVDAIDMIDCKIRLIYEATRATTGEGNHPVLFSSMGAGRKVDTEQIRITEFWKVEGCPLARALRQRMKKMQLLPQRKFRCVYSPELSGEKGTIAPIVGVFGMKLAGAVIQAIINKEKN